MSTITPESLHRDALRDGWKLAYAYAARHTSALDAVAFANHYCELPEVADEPLMVYWPGFRDVFPDWAAEHDIVWD